jgi:DNA-binding GntR family transcriptional regulator
LEDNDQPVTISELVRETGASEYSVRLALTRLGIEGKSPIHNRRIVQYPPGTLKKVREWLEANR